MQFMLTCETEALCRSQASEEAACHWLEVSPWTSHFSVISHVYCLEDIATAVIPQTCPVWSAQDQHALYLKKKRKEKKKESIGNIHKLQISCENPDLQYDTGCVHLRCSGELQLSGP